MSGTDISVGIVSFRTDTETAAAVRSLEEHTDASLRKHIYVVDNAASIDGTSSALKALADSYADVTYHAANTNLGYGRANNLVLPYLRSRYHVIMNPDVLLKEDSLRLLYDFMESNPSCVMAIPRLVGERGTILPVYRKDPTVLDLFARRFAPHLLRKRTASHGLSGSDFEKPFEVPFAQGSFLIVRTEDLKAERGFDDRFFMYMEDADLCRRMRKRGDLLYTPATTVMHSWRQGSKRNLRLFFIHVHSIWQYFEKWGFQWL